MFTRLTKAVGPKGYYLALCRSLRRVPFPISVRSFGEVGTIAEILNLHDNFGHGELRDPLIEDELRRGPAPVVVDCGVNVGVTVRWWFHLNPRCRVFGLDMMQEAQDLTRQRLAGREVDYTGLTAVLAAADGEAVTVRFDDPLEGRNRIDGGTGRNERKLVSARLDTLLAPYRLERIDVLKIDIEGQAGRALLGAPQVLAMTRNVILETHGEAELADAVAILVGAAGFRLRHYGNRNLWFTRPEVQRAN